MDLDDLVVLQSVVDQGGFTRAALAQHMTQSAVSQTIKRLEERFGTPLLERTTPPRPTPAGQRVLGFTKDTLKNALTLEHDLADLSVPKSVRIALGASRVVSEFFLPKVLVALQRQRPQLIVDVRTMASRELIGAVRQGEVDLGFGPFQKGMRQLQTRRYFNESFALYASEKHRLFGALKKGNEEALQSCTLFTSHLDPLENRPAKKRLRYRFKKINEITSLPLRTELVAAGFGVTYLPKLYVRRRAQKMRLRALTRFDFGTLEREFGVYFLREQKLKSAVMTLITALDSAYDA